MYILNRRRKRNRAILVVLAVLALLGGSAYAGRDLLDTDTYISPPPAAVIGHVSGDRPVTKPFDERLYRFELPADWEKFQLPDARAGSQSWRNTADNKGVRVITIYTDAAVSELAVNRVLSVQAAGDGMTVTGDVSDNCTEFTNPGRQPAGNGTASAKWHDVEFLCDTGNFARNVVGISSPDVMHGVKLSGAASGRHEIFMTYTDSSASPDYGIFTNMVSSFRLK